MTQEELQTLEETRNQIKDILEKNGVDKGMETEEFQDAYGFYSDYHKDVFGVRPHFRTKEDFLAHFGL